MCTPSCGKQAVHLETEKVKWQIKAPQLAFLAKHINENNLLKFKDDLVGLEHSLVDAFMAN